MINPPGAGPRGRKILRFVFLARVVHNQPKKTIKSLSTGKSNGKTQGPRLYSIDIGMTHIFRVCVVLIDIL